MTFCNIYIVLHHSKSKGSLTLTTKDPYSYPAINPNLLSDPENYDIERLYEATQLTINLTQTPPFQRLNATLFPIVLPACRNYTYLSREFFYCQLRQETHPYHQPIGTCRMGNDSRTSVVNSELRVHGMRGLRVADASVFPHSTSGHLTAPVIMVGEKLADMLKEEYPVGCDD